MKDGLRNFGPAILLGLLMLGSVAALGAFDGLDLTLEPASFALDLEARVKVAGSD